jgi:hypothetical protein
MAKVPPPILSFDHRQLRPIKWRPPLLPLVAAALLVLTPAVQADPILRPVAASTDMTSVTSPDNTRDGSGLSADYASLVDDFDIYIASNPTHDSSFDNSWQSAGGDDTGNFDFELGGSYVIESFALWNRGGNLPENLFEFTLLADDNAAFSSPVFLGSFTANDNTGDSSNVLPEVFTFFPTEASFVRLVIASNSGDVAFTSFGEAAFEVQQAVPEPPLLALLAAGAVALIAVRRKYSRF